MAEKREPINWITIKGRHIPIYEGQTEDDAIWDFIEKQKEKQIAENKKQADERNNNDTNNANPNKVLNSLDKSELGTHYNNLSPHDRYVINGLTNLRQADIDHLKAKATNTSEGVATIAGKKYKCVAQFENGKIVYTLKQGNKIIVKKGKQSSVLNQMAMIFQKESR